ncbi:DUF397 domain-containing protein [Sphaerisporangium sp. NPDC049002]|uniref:DUF397 domain-containing protein n=1 Tax=Sphaerisporangium sp. NPDC049002 TaxID=3155392 RepID=UPI0033FC4CC9
MDSKDLTAADLLKADWKKSSRSGNNGGQCVEVAGNLPELVAVRDSKNPAGPVLVFTPGEWTTFLGDVKTGRLG